VIKKNILFKFNYLITISLWNTGIIEIMEYWVRKGFKSNFSIIDPDPLNPSFHYSIFPFFHF